MTDLFYAKRNDARLFCNSGAYSHVGNNEYFTQNEARQTLNRQNETNNNNVYDNEYDNEFDENYQHSSIYDYDSDHGESSFFMPKQPKQTVENTTVRRRTLPSSQGYIPTSNGWD